MDQLPEEEQPLRYDCCLTLGQFPAVFFTADILELFDLLGGELHTVTVSLAYRSLG